MMSQQIGDWKIVSEEDLEDHNWYLIAVEGYGTPLKAKYHSDGIPEFQAFTVDPWSGNSYWKYFDVDDVKYYMEMPKLPWEDKE